MSPDDVSGMLERHGSMPAPEVVEAVPTGSLGLDIALGVQGWPLGREIEIYGAPSTGRTTLAYHSLANAQLAGLNTILITNNYDAAYGARLGINNGKLLITPHLFVLSFGQGWVNSPFIVVDVPFDELEEQPLPGTTVIYLTETRANLCQDMWGNTARTGKLSASVLVKLLSGDANAMKQQQTVTAVIQRNPYAPVNEGAVFNIRWGAGIDQARELVILGEKYGLVERSGNWVRMVAAATPLRFNGTDNLAAQLRHYPYILDWMEREIRIRAAMVVC